MLYNHVFAHRHRYMEWLTYTYKRNPDTLRAIFMCAQTISFDLKTNGISSRGRLWAAGCLASLKCANFTKQCLFQALLSGT